jgi:hypothetical protein
MGPTKCDNDRLSREVDLDKTWQIMKPLLEKGNFKPSSYSIVSLAIDLLREAMNCYQNGAYLATCGVCRTCIEAALYQSTSKKSVIDLSTSTVREYARKDKRESFLQYALNDGLITNQEVTTIKYIWEAGDFAAHVHQKLDLNYRDFEKHVSIKQSIEFLPIKAWSNRHEALEILTETTKILSNILATLKTNIEF